MAELLITPSQTIGPFFAEGLKWKEGAILFPESAAGAYPPAGGDCRRHRQDGPDSLIEFWQPMLPDASAGRAQHLLGFSARDD